MSRRPPRPRPPQRRLTEWAPVPLDPFWLNVPVRLRIACSDILVSADSSKVGGYRYDDGNGCQRWLILPVADPATGLYTTGEYTISKSDGAGYLAAGRDGPGVVLAPSDDGSGLQRWIFRPNDGEYNTFTMRVAGGKRDELVFLGSTLGRDPITHLPSLKLHSTSTGSRRRMTLELVEACDESDDDEAPEAPLEENADQEADIDDQKADPEADIDDQKADPEADNDTEAPSTNGTEYSGTRIPGEMADKLSSLTKLTPLHIDIIQQLISLPENSTPQWYKNYGFVEFLGDGRGFTTTIFGACSGTGDLAMVFDELKRIEPRSETCDRLLTFLPTLKQKRGDDIRGIEGIKPLIESLGDDPAWRRAVWATYSKLYWRFAMDYADKVGEARSRPGPPLRLPASRGFMVDTAVNHGANVESLDTIVRRMPASARSSSDERTWVTAFARARQQLLVSGYQELDTSGTGDRCSLWLDLIATNPDLTTPVKAYKGYWGSYTLT